MVTKDRNPLVSIQILNWNRAEETVRAIKSAYKQDYPNFEVVVVDNGSIDNSVQMILEMFPSIKLIELGSNYGCPGGRNRGISYCDGDYIFFCDNDGVLHRNSVSNAMKIFLSNRSVAIVTGKVFDFNSEEEIDVGFEIHDKIKYEYFTFQGGIVMIKKFVFNEISFFPDDYMYGSEELFLGLKVLDHGFTIIKTNTVVLWHKKSAKARNISLELLNAYKNKLASCFQLYPLENFILFLFYFCLVYPYYSYKHGFFREFVYRFPSIFVDVFKYERKPISRKTFYKYLQLKRKKDY